MSLRLLLSDLANRLVVLVIIVGLTFLLPRLLPGDPLDLMASPDAARSLTVEEAKRLRVVMGLDGTWLEQFLAYLQRLATGDLGYSLQHAAPVGAILAKAMPWTALLIGLSLPIFLIVGVGTGIEAGLRRHSAIDRGLTSAMAVVGSLPPFAWAVFLLIGFAIAWPVFPSAGAEPLFPAANWWVRTTDVLRHAALPAIALAMHEVVRYFFLARGETIVLTARPFMVNARARGVRGVRGWRLRHNYLFANMRAPLLARLSDSVTGLVTAILFVELAFSYPGVGQVIYLAILQRDYSLLQGAVLMLSAMVLLINWVVDIAAANLADRG